MYIKIIGHDRSVLYIDINEKPTLSVYFSDEEDIWMATTIKDGVMLILHAGEMSDCHAIVNNVLDELKLKPKSLNN